MKPTKKVLWIALSALCVFGCRDRDEGITVHQSPFQFVDDPSLSEGLTPEEDKERLSETAQMMLEAEIRKGVYIEGVLHRDIEDIDPNIRSGVIYSEKSRKAECYWYEMTFKIDGILEYTQRVDFVLRTRQWEWRPIY